MNDTNNDCEHNPFQNVIAVTNRHLSKRPFLEQVERICKCHPEAILLREKDLSADEYKKLATSISENKNSVDEIYNKLQLLCGVEINDSMPTNTQTGLWINPTSNESINIPELKDNVVNTTDTWSSKKIYDEIQVLTNKLNTLETKTQTVSDEDADTYLGGN